MSSVSATLGIIQSIIQVTWKVKSRLVIWIRAQCLLEYVLAKCIKASDDSQYIAEENQSIHVPDSKVHEVNMGPYIGSVGPQMGPMNLVYQGKSSSPVLSISADPCNDFYCRHPCQSITVTMDRLVDIIKCQESDSIKRSPFLVKGFITPSSF